MRYTFIKYNVFAGGNKRKDVDMLLIETVTDVFSAIKRVLGPSAVAQITDPHSLWESQKQSDGTIIPSAQQLFCNPIYMVNSAFHNMAEGIREKKKYIMNEKGGYQPLLDDMDSIGWKEISREKRETITFNKY